MCAVAEHGQEGVYVSCGVCVRETFSDVTGERDHRPSASWLTAGLNIVCVCLRRAMCFFVFGGRGGDNINL